MMDGDARRAGTGDSCLGEAYNSNKPPAGTASHKRCLMKGFDDEENEGRGMDVDIGRRGSVVVGGIVLHKPLGCGTKPRLR